MNENRISQLNKAPPVEYWCLASYVTPRRRPEVEPAVVTIRLMRGRKSPANPGVPLTHFIRSRSPFCNRLRVALLNRVVHHSAYDTTVFIYTPNDVIDLSGKCVAFFALNSCGSPDRKRVGTHPLYTIYKKQPTALDDSRICLFTFRTIKVLI